MQQFVVDKRAFLLHRYVWDKTIKQFEHRARWACAIGRLEYPTPSGVFVIRAHALNPDWQMPDSDWVPEEDRGKIIKGGDPANPLVGAFMDFGFLGVGIHGTRDLASLGTAASHGCIRVRPEVAIRIANLNPDGSRVVIV
jgi:lipoprotein-anchoring transpeptidase ErfK/SrfK